MESISLLFLTDCAAVWTVISYTTKQVANRVTIFRCVDRSTLSETKKGIKNRIDGRRQTENVGYEFAHMIYVVSMSQNVELKLETTKYTNLTFL